MRLDWKVLMSTLIFALCTSAALVSYTPYSFRWDDSEYLWRSLALTKAFWSGNVHETRAAMVSVRPPVMTFLGLPWGPLASWDAAGKCFVTLVAFTALAVACSFFLLLRIGLHPLYLVIAGVCVFAALGPYPTGSSLHSEATAFMVDSLFAWIAFAAILLIPYEASNPTTSSVSGALARGALWAGILSFGAVTKLSFLYFIAVIIPVLLVVRAWRSGLRNAFLSLASLSVCSLPAIIYWLRYGRIILDYGRAAAFGHTADYYFVPFSRFVSETLQQSPGLWTSLLLTLALGGYLILKRSDLFWGSWLLATLILIGYCAICLVSTNREIRFLLPGIIAFPFLIGIPIFAKDQSYSRKTALMMAALVFCVLVLAAIPMRHRLNRECLSASEAVLAQATQSNARHVLLATDSSTLNAALIRIAIEVSPSRPPVQTDTLSWNAAFGRSVEDDFHEIRESDLVVFQNKEALDSSYTNQRVAEYEQYARQHFGDAPIKVTDGVRIYGKSQIDPSKP